MAKHESLPVVGASLRVNQTRRGKNDGPVSSKFADKSLRVWWESGHVRTAMVWNISDEERASRPSTRYAI